MILQNVISFCSIINRKKLKKIRIDRTWEIVDNYEMKKVQLTIRWQPWIIEAVKVYSQKNGMDFSGAMNFLVESELNSYGYFRKDYQPGIVDEQIEAEEGQMINALQKRTGTD